VNAYVEAQAQTPTSFGMTSNIAQVTRLTPTIKYNYNATDQDQAACKSRHNGQVSGTIEFMRTKRQPEEGQQKA